MMTRKCGAAAAAVVLAASGASAQEVVGLTSNNRLVRFSAADPSMILGSSPTISGLSEFDTIVDIDWYPVTGRLYGMGSSTGTLYEIDPVTGVATVDAVPQSAIADPADIDFNPVADRLRVFSDGGFNFRLTPGSNRSGPTGSNSGLVSDDGSVAYPGGIPTPALVASAYDNNSTAAVSTTLYSIDTGTNSLVIHSGGPQFSMLATVGPLGLTVGQNVGFDVAPSGIAYVSDDNNFYTINLGTGALTSVGFIGTGLEVTSITVIPAPGAVPAIGMLGLLTLRRRR